MTQHFKPDTGYQIWTDSCQILLKCDLFRMHLLWKHFRIYKGSVHSNILLSFVIFGPILNRQYLSPGIMILFSLNLLKISSPKQTNDKNLRRCWPEYNKLVRQHHAGNFTNEKEITDALRPCSTKEGEERFSYD